MTKPKDEDVEKRAIDLARKDDLEWVKRPRQKGGPETPAGATNDERNGYREQAADQMNKEQAPE